jgi:hypothetical protein
MIFRNSSEQENLVHRPGPVKPAASESGKMSLAGLPRQLFFNLSE